MKQRILSVDVLRGMTMFLMIIVNNPGDWGAIYAPLEHAPWHGLTPTDWVFPFFIFISGVSLRLAHEPTPLSRDSVLQITARTLRIFTLGFSLAFFSKIQWAGMPDMGLLALKILFYVVVGYLMLANFNTRTKLLTAGITLAVLFVLAFSGIESFSTVRIPGVLQRIAVVYGVIALLYHRLNQRQLITTAIVILVAYWATLTFIPVPGIGAANYEKGTNLASWLDAQILGNHAYAATKPWDPEGVLSTLPAIATGILGILVGYKLLQHNLGKLLQLGFFMLMAGWFWGMYFPINKQLWTSSYVLATAGIATMLLAALEWLGERNPTAGFFKMWGMNAIFVFFLAGIIPRILGAIKVGETPLSKFLYNQVFVEHITDPKLASLGWALAFVAFWSLILWWMKKRQWFLKV